MKLCGKVPRLRRTKVVRPGFNFSGMMIAYSRGELENYIHLAVEAARDAGTQTILVDGGFVAR